MEPDEGEAASVVERALALRRLSGLEALDPELLTTLASRTELRRHRAGEALALAEDPRPALHLVLEGRVGGDGAPSESSVSAGGLVGDRTAAGAVRALEDSLTLALPVEDLTELCEEHFGLLLAVMRVVARAALAKQGAPAEPRDGRACSPSPSDELDLGGRIAFLSASPIFEGVRVETLGQLALEAMPLDLHDGERLWSIGEAPGAIVVVMQGSLRCRSEAGEFRIGPGALGGLAEAIAASPRWYDAEVDGNVRGLRLEVSALFDAMEDDPELAADVLGALARSAAPGLGL